MPFVITNNASSTLASPASVGATTFSVASGAGSSFPSLSAGQYTYVRLGTNSSNEVATVTARTGDAFTCGALSSLWDTGAAVSLTVSKEFFDDIIQTEANDTEVKELLLTDYSEEYIDNGSVGTGTLTLDFEDGNNQAVTATGNFTIDVTNAPASGTTGMMNLKITNGGAHTITWAAKIKHPGGTAPTLTTSGRDRLVLITDDGGTTVDMTSAGADFS